MKTTEAFVDICFHLGCELYGVIPTKAICKTFDCTEMVAERDTSEHKNNLFKLQEARAFADRSEQSAVLKRQRAQILMENADLTTYKAIMALRIAEAAEIAETPGAIASFFLVP